ncbi:Protein phosphatase PP2A regulatory subunit B [Puccinia graminis f. sp. tritici]|uniref:Protein phosphatase PP2A regulatory subunit B n=1 Tax=Puccinia graminis f. sp. tritici TaxID=56615 RepID=A0A5B0N956_PUCGR|nr:Protein phosphatase PP2A regulatory subunit B [Puccinia graminis f. sp. tritici]
MREIFYGPKQKNHSSSRIARAAAAPAVKSSKANDAQSEHSSRSSGSELAQAEEDGGHFERYEGLRRGEPGSIRGRNLRFGAYDNNDPEVLGDVEADQAAGQTLQNDPKERAENLMITDLIRHDLLGSASLARSVLPGSSASNPLPPCTVSSPPSRAHSVLI